MRRIGALDAFEAHAAILHRHSFEHPCNSDLCRVAADLVNFQPPALMLRSKRPVFRAITCLVSFWTSRRPSSTESGTVFALGSASACSIGVPWEFSRMLGRRRRSQFAISGTRPLLFPSYSQFQFQTGETRALVSTNRDSEMSLAISRGHFPLKTKQRVCTRRPISGRFANRPLEKNQPT